MKKILFLIFFVLFASCSTEKKVFWCGDHPCINKKEKKAYFQSTGIVEVKVIAKGDNKNTSKMDKIIEQAYKKEKKRINNEKKS